MRLRKEAYKTHVTWKVVSKMKKTAIVVLSLCFGCLLSEQDKHHKYYYDNCHYKFHVWKPEENILEKIKNLETNLNHSKLNYNNDFLLLKLQVLPKEIEKINYSFPQIITTV